MKTHGDSLRLTGSVGQMAGLNWLIFLVSLKTCDQAECMMYLECYITCRYITALPCI